MRVRVKNHVMLRLGATRPQRLEGRKTGWQPHHDNVYAASEARGWDPQSQVEAMDAEGLDLAVLYPSVACLCWASTPPNRSVVTASSPSSPPPSPVPTTTG